MTFARSDGASAGRATIWGRTAALVAAGVISLTLMLDPYMLNGASALRVHEGLPLLMLGVSSAFVYGLGFRPARIATRVLLHPAVTWALLGIGGALVVLR